MGARRISDDVIALDDIFDVNRLQKGEIVKINF
jgi:hypothetical protein